MLPGLMFVATLIPMSLRTPNRSPAGTSRNTLTSLLATSCKCLIHMRNDTWQFWGNDLAEPEIW